MILSNGTNQFPNNEFSFWEWSAPILQTPEEVQQKLNDPHPEGRVLKDIIAIGMGYGWTTDNILEMTYLYRQCCAEISRSGKDPEMPQPAVSHMV